MDTWEDRMAERAAVRRGLREAERWANEDGPSCICGFEYCDGVTTASGPVSVTPTLPSDLAIGDHIYFVVNGKLAYHRIVGEQ